MSGHDNEWTVATLKAYFEALRTEDQKAVMLLAKDMAERLNLLARSFEELKTSVEQFHASFKGRKEEGATMFLRVANIITIVIALGTLAAFVLYRH